jgi:hypothetical protein
MEIKRRLNGINVTRVENSLISIVLSILTGRHIHRRLYRVSYVI